MGKHVEVQAFRENINHSSADGSMTPSTLDASKLSSTTLAELLAARVVPVPSEPTAPVEPESEDE